MRKATKTIVYEGMEKTIVEWAKLSGISTLTVYQRARRGWTPEKMLSTAPQHSFWGPGGPPIAKLKKPAPEDVERWRKARAAANQGML